MLSALWDSFTDWLFLWVSPVRNFEALWILVPIYLSWILTEFWQEKVRTSFGNAIANGVIPLWASVDWSRYLLWSMRAAHTGLTHDPLLKFLVYLLTLIYGLVNIVQGIRAKKFIHHFGRIREVSYCMIVFTSVGLLVQNPVLVPHLLLRRPVHR